MTDRRTWQEWDEFMLMPMRIADPDGFRWRGASTDGLYTESEFLERRKYCTLTSRENFVERVEALKEKSRRNTGQLPLAPEIFNEETLRREIARVWGEHGAHMDVYKELLKRAQKNG